MTNSKASMVSVIQLKNKQVLELYSELGKLQVENKDLLTIYSKTYGKVNFYFCFF